MNNNNEVKTIFMKDVFLEKQLKEALLLQWISNEPINILIIGENASGKTRLLKSMNNLVQDSEYINCGVIGNSIQLREQLTKEKRTLLLLDDIFALSDNDVTLLKDLLEAGIKVIAVCCPKFGRYKDYEIIMKQIGMPSSLIDFFDLIFILRDLPEREKDEALINLVLEDKKDSKVDSEELSDFISNCRRFSPKLSDEAKSKIRDYYLKMRESVYEEGKPIPIGIKQAQTIVKLAKANAMLDGSITITKENADRSIALLEHFLAQVGLNPETGRIDIDRIDKSLSEEDKIFQISKIIEDLEKSPAKTILVSDIMKKANEYNIDAEEVNNALYAMSNKGELFDIKERVIQRV